MFSASSLWDYYERDKAVSSLSHFEAQRGAWLPGEDTAGIFLDITAEACGARCLANAGCSSFDYGMETCADSKITGYVNVSSFVRQRFKRMHFNRAYVLFLSQRI